MSRSTLALPVVVLVLVLGGCKSKPPTSDGAAGSGPISGGGGSGGAVATPCDQDADGFTNASCGGNDCNDRNPAVYPGATEVCGNGIDDNCDGKVDEGCSCTPGTRRPCYPPGPDDATRNVGACRDGEEVCSATGLAWSDCTGAVIPTTEGTTCDGIDQDCNGTPDDNLTNKCGVCGPAPQEICGNGLDDDCDGEIDNAELCTVSCKGLDVENPPPGLECCFKSPDAPGLTDRPVPFSYTCVDDPDPAHAMQPCLGDPDTSRACLNINGDATACVRTCVDDNHDGIKDRCLCGVLATASATVATQSASCGFPTACAHVTCEERLNQPCYSGPPQTLGKGICHGGSFSCSADPGTGALSWSECQGEQLPQKEVCGNGEDDDCDGLIDEEDGATGKRCEYACPPDAMELCGDHIDNNCNGFVDEGCLAKSESQACYAGPQGTRNTGACQDGVQHRVGEVWGDCVGSVGPAPEKCGDGIDSDCNGYGGPGQPEDVGCCVADPDGEKCDGLDNDCDGLVDEGVINACGKCLGESCDTIEEHQPANCVAGSDRSCSRIVPDDNDPDAFTLATDKRGGGASNVIYIAVTDREQVAKMDTITGQKVWQVDSHGNDPSRTAVPLDDSCWVANRGFNAPDDPEFSNVVHLDRDGNMICRAPVKGLARALAIDANGDVWAGSFNHGDIWKFAGNTTNGVDADGFPICATIDISPDDPTDDAFHPTTYFSHYGFAFDDRGIMWDSTLDTTTMRLDTNTMTYDTIKHVPTTYGIAVDTNGNSWYGGFGGAAHEIDANGPYVNQAVYEHDTTAPSLPVTVAHDGFIWASDTSNTLSRIDPLTYQVVGQWKVPNNIGSDARGCAEDSSFKIWLPMLNGGRAARFDPETETFDSFDVDPGHELYSYSDMTGSQLRQFVARQGTWTQVIDSGYSNTIWNQIDWHQNKPKGTVIDVHAQFAPSRDKLDTTASVCGPLPDPPVDLEKLCPQAHNQRFGSFSFALRGTRDGTKPSVGAVRVSYSRP